VGLLAGGYLLPIGTVTFNTRVAESAFYSVLVFSPISAEAAVRIRHQALVVAPTRLRDNLLGAMAGGVAEYASLALGYRALAIVIAVCYIGAIAVRIVGQVLNSRTAQPECRFRRPYVNSRPDPRTYQLNRTPTRIANVRVWIVWMLPPPDLSALRSRCSCAR